MIIESNVINETKGFLNINEALSLYRISDEETDAIKSFSKEAKKHLNSFINDFYDWIVQVPEYKKLFSTGDQLIEQVKEKQIKYWSQLFDAQVSDEYFQSRYKVGEIHANIRLPMSSYVAGMSFSSDWWTSKIKETEVKGKDTCLLNAFNKLLLLDVAIVSSSYMQMSNNLIEKQSRALMEVSTPTIQLWEGILILPILGVLDSRRAQGMTEIMLNKIQQTNAKTIIIDITGVPTVDSSVANHLIKITKATKLMGCECVLSGIGPEIAQTLVHLGVNLDSVQTSSNLKSAFQSSLLKTGFHIKTK